MVVFFGKQKTADEMRISDWSSDVCSSDLSRMVTRARSWVRLETKPLRPRLAVRLPGSLDDLAFRDGIEDVHYKNKGIRRWWLRQVVTATPLTLWEHRKSVV